MYFLSKSSGNLGFLLKGNCLYKLNRQEEAIKSFDKALELMPNCVGAIYNKGFIEQCLPSRMHLQIMIPDVLQDSSVWQQGRSRGLLSIAFHIFYTICFCL